MSDFEVFQQGLTGLYHIKGVDATFTSLRDAERVCRDLNYYQAKADSWKRTAGEELHKCTVAETKLEILKNKILEFRAKANRSYQMTYEDYELGLVEAYDNILKVLDETEKNLGEL